MMDTQNNVDKLERILTVLAQWSGVSDSSPPDTEIIRADSGETIYLEDLQEAFTFLSDIKTR